MKKTLLLIHFAALYVLLAFPLPGRAQLQILPENHVFEDTQTGLAAPGQIFTITNTSEQPFELIPDNILLKGKNTQTTSLSVLSYNIETDDGNWPGRFAYMLEEMRQMDVDIIGLQEVIQRANLDNQAMQMADSLGFYYYFDSVDDENSVQRYGNAIISRYPIEETNYRALVPLDRFRTAIHIRVNVEGNVVDVYNTHLHHHPLDHHIRIEQVIDLMDFIEETNSGGFIFITGDFNANPDWEEMQLLYDDFMDVYPLFHENHLDPEHATLNYKLGHQMRRIDYVLFGKAGLDNLVPVSAEIVLNDEHEDFEMESDHFGVLGRFELLGDNSHFSLNKPQESIMLDPGESTTAEVTFQPRTTGYWQAELNVSELIAEIAGEGFDATITSFPFTENFSEVPQFELPFGWSSNAENWYVFNSSFAGGEEPELVFWWQPENEGNLHVRTPPLYTAGLDSLTVSFRHYAEDFQDTGGYDLGLVAIAHDQQYPVLQWTNPGNIEAQEVQVTLNSSDHGVGAEMLFLAWVYEGPSDAIVRWAIDDLEVSALPALQITPAYFDFDLQEIYTQSGPVPFIMTNIGGDLLEIAPDQISISGDQSGQFMLQVPQGQISLSHGESDTLYVSFAPQEAGQIEAQLLVRERVVELQGESFDATITQLPWTEDFSAQVQGGVPLGWQSDTRNWEAFMLSNAGGTPPEMVFWWQPVKQGRFYLTTPRIETQGKDTLVLSFKYRVRNFQQPGIYTLSVVAIADGEEYIIEEWVNPDFIHPTEFIGIIDSSNHQLGAESFRLAWVFDGATDNMVSWDFDDIHLYNPGDTPIPDISPRSHNFGSQQIGSFSEPVQFSVTNNGGGQWIINPEDIHISGPDADDFVLQDFDTPISLNLLETSGFFVSFSPSAQGPRNATLTLDTLEVVLTGFGNEPTDYFIYSDFTIPGLTNVEGFREIPGWAQGMLASDIADEGEFGGTVLQLDYDLDQANDLTSYWMWAFPPVDLSSFSELVLVVRSDVPVTDLRVQVLDSDFIAGNGGASYVYFDSETNWQELVFQINDLTPLEGAAGHPDLSKIQRIDLVFEDGETQPQQATVWVDVVALKADEVFVNETDTPADMHLFPNPATSYVNIKSPPGSRISIFSSDGRLVKQSISNDYHSEIRLAGIQPGVYLVEVKNSSNQKVKKLIIH